MNFVNTKTAEWQNFDIQRFLLDVDKMVIIYISRIFE